MIRYEFFFLVFSVLFLTSCSGNRPENLGVTDGRFVPCPGSPNCVSSQSADEEHYIDPLVYEGTMTEAHEKLLAVLHSMKRARIVTQQDLYIHAEFTSGLFRFVDDVEFFFDDEHNTIHVRSASRVGYSDLGANRKRIERIRDEFSSQE